MKPIRESRELDWEGEHMKPNTLLTRPLSTRTKPPNFEKMWRETQQQFNKMETRAMRAEASLKLAKAIIDEALAQWEGQCLATQSLALTHKGDKQ